MEESKSKLLSWTAAEAFMLLNKHGLTDWLFQWDRAKTRCGLCNCTRKIISLSLHLTPHRTREAIRNTILHEIAHALVGCAHGHDEVWQAKAKEIGCTGDRRSSDITNRVNCEWVGVCPSCQLTIYRHTRTAKAVCAKCCDEKNNGKTHERFAFQWHESQTQFINA